MGKRSVSFADLHELMGFMMDLIPKSNRSKPQMFGAVKRNGQVCIKHVGHMVTSRLGAVTLNVYSIFQMRMEELCEEMVARSQQR